MSPRLLLATHNTDKVREYRILLQGLSYELITLGEAGIAHKVEEDGDSFEENALAKARAYASLSGLLTLGEDSGLEVDALGGEPGVRSARYAGEGAPNEERLRLLLSRLEGVPWEKRTARFCCVIALAEPGGRTETFAGECHGLITFEPQGAGGFGYDPVFYFPELGQTFAQLPLEVKCRASHRGQAARLARRALEQSALKELTR